MRRRTVLSLEQALSLSHGTQRLAHLGFRVIRIEATPDGKGTATPGDPNRYVGRPCAGPHRAAYFVAPNAGKQAITLDLKQAQGRQLLLRLVRALEVDVFCVNTLPMRYRSLGVDYETLSAARPELIWVGVSAYGPDHPDVPGYDPALQADLGIMHLTGPSDGPPQLAGLPLVDLKAGDEVFAQVMLALAELAETGRGKRVDISMAQAAASWHLTTLPLLDLGTPPEELVRTGAEHRAWVPVNVYPTADGWVYLAIGNNRQWLAFCAIEGLEKLSTPERATNEGRRAGREALHRDIAALLPARRTQEWIDLFRTAGLPCASIRDIEALRAHPAIAPRLLTTRTPDGRAVRLPPPAVETEALSAAGRELGFAPDYGADTDAVLAEAGVAEAERADLRTRGVV
ncbi:MAG: CoA transferase [Deltaproteobacteria bacterium]|nr:CoA transferase [Deltaproteobacteria bacterium]